MSDFATEPVEPADDLADFDPVDDLDLELADGQQPSEPSAWAPSLEPEPSALPFSRGEWDATLAFLERRVEEELGPLRARMQWEHENVPDPESGRTGAQDLNRAELEVASFPDAFPDELRGLIRETADAHALELGAAYGAGRDVGEAALLQAAADVTTAAAVHAWHVDAVDQVARARGLDPAAIDEERTFADAEQRYGKLLAEKPDLDPQLALGLAVVAAVDAQDGRDIERPLSDAWGLAGTLVRGFQPTRPETTHDYTKGGSVTARFFGQKGQAR